MPQVLDWHNADSRDLIRCVVQALAAGKLVALPTETVYGVAASGLLPDAVARLARARQLPEAHSLPLAVAGPAEALDWVPEMNFLGRRLARRCWPGPVTLVFDEAGRGVASRLPDAVRRHVCPTGSVALRAPAHEALLGILRLLPGPLLLTAAARGEEPAAATGEQVVQALGAAVDVVLDDGACQYGQPSTVVRVDGKRWQVLREGLVPAELVRRQTACILVFVCTGNTCRSPLAEAVCKKMLAERLGCTPAELPQRGFLVLSAGLAAMMGARAAEEAVAVAAELGADLSSHRSRSLTADLARQADCLLVMTHGHAEAVREQFGHVSPRLCLLDPSGEDIADPIGSDLPVYRECARQIAGHLERWVAEFQEQALPPPEGDNV
jgi:tRNA threonylcarbamoyl adenosine modification protein (Sua5/YciO/YrdC/YwlC family)